MSKMKAAVFAAKAKEIATNYKTLYVMGAFGAPLTAANKARYRNNCDYNRQPSRQALIDAASSDTFAFDCCGLIKGILWGWSGKLNSSYGGANYASNGVPDLNAGGLINACPSTSKDFTKIDVGEVCWKEGHIGIYIGGGLAVECTPAWRDKVQITSANCDRAGYNRRNWTKHGKLPYIDYTQDEPKPDPEPDVEPEPDPNPQTLPFVDVPEDAYYRKAVQWAYANGITKGTSSTEFSPDRDITRAEAVTMMYRLYKLIEGGG